MDAHRRATAPSKVAIALQQIADKREKQAAKRAEIAISISLSETNAKEKENDACLIDFESTSGTAQNPESRQNIRHAFHRDSKASTMDINFTNLDSLTCSMSDMALAENRDFLNNGRQLPQTMNSQLIAASRVHLPDEDICDSSRATDCNNNDMPGQMQHAALSAGHDDDDEKSTMQTREGTCTAGAPCQEASQPLVLGERKEFTLDVKVAGKLYPHQVDGVKWLWSLHQLKRGGILGDDMGLGKTMQCSAFLSGMFLSRLCKRVLIIAPKTLLLHWGKELAVCGLGSRIYNYFGESESERGQALRAVASPTGSGGIMLTTYGMVLHNHEQLRIIKTGVAVAAGKSSLNTAGGFSGASKASSRELMDKGHEPQEDEDEDVLPWDMIILDEGHKIKNPNMKLSEALRHLPARLRIIISGTPIQNNLLEMHALFDYCCHGLLGNRKAFSDTYAKLITAGQDRDASERERLKGAAVAAELRRVIAPFFLRREKRDVLRQQGSEEESAESGASSSSQTISRKNDLVVWLRLTPLQQQIYKAFLRSDSVSAALNQSASVLAALTVLKKICDHPGLLSANATHSVISGSHKWKEGEKKGSASVKNDTGRSRHGYSLHDDFIVNSSEEDEDSCLSSDSDSEELCDEVEQHDRYPDRENHRGERAAVAGHAAPPPSSTAEKWEDEEWMKLAQASVVEDKLLKEIERKGPEASCKCLFVLTLLDQLTAAGHRTLIFSQSRVMLDILEASIRARGMKMCRIDGTMLSAEERQAEVRKFQAPGSNIPVFLLTSQVGGLGLTLTAADRVIIVDPNWNPAIDNQSVDRAYRIGQKKDVVVYRLITCGTVEEKIYRKQVFKGGLSKTGTEQGVQFRYFAMQELRDLFTVTPEGLASSETKRQLHELHADQRQHSASLSAHMKWLNSVEGFSGVSDHDLLFSRHAQDKAPSAQEEREIIKEVQSQAVAAEELSNMMRSNLKLNGGVKAASKEDLAKAAQQKQARAVQELEQQLQRQLELLSNIGFSMGDGGAKIRLRINTLESELSRERVVLRSYDHQQGPLLSAGTTSSTDYHPTQQLADTDHSASKRSGSERPSGQRVHMEEAPQVLIRDQISGPHQAPSTVLLSNREGGKQPLMGQAVQLSGKNTGYVLQNDLDKDPRLRSEVPNGHAHGSSSGQLPVSSAFTQASSQAPSGGHLASTAPSLVAPTVHKKGLNITFHKKHQQAYVQSPSQSTDSVSFLSATSEIVAEDLADSATTSKNFLASGSDTAQQTYYRGTAPEIGPSKKHLVIDLSDE
ncbi:hypothetical protein CEUSTIGMA_g2905.t1 [Chlamydomonas eustigma]|uniref:Uncharacterized protein n=1 Tax=Chlamydomonas eustigma TaxID=1157962 RepID=A0A250WXW9_9CHLO|nr:hypothetical protein CEUSTIGMA_g2905.t1 [Chlamydomonas eustigma]|eukprot:GAX75462.1 hypothetical protein CEUSTIGMA_g2905.t1 [Chlamydomonas eustigma]